MSVSTPILFEVSDGLATLGPEALKVSQALENRFLRWAAQYGADPMAFPSLVRIADLDGFDYFDNFPHLALLTSRLEPLQTESYSRQASPTRKIPSRHLTDSEYTLPSAACYSVYLHLAGTRLRGPRYLTTVAQCYRNEECLSGLSRLWGFRMREIVCLGPADTVKSFLEEMKATIMAFAVAIGLPLNLETATDPFYDMRGRRALMQKLAPVKHEFVYGGSVAVASANFHRNFFGERSDIRTPDGQPAFSGCVAFGLERWLHALCDRFGNDTAKICGLLERRAT